VSVTAQTADTPKAAPLLGPALAAALVFGSSGSVLVIELVSLRLLAPYVGLTLEMSTAVIGVALAAIAIGAWLGGRAADVVSAQRLLGPLFLAGGALTLAISPLVRGFGEWGGDDARSQVLALAGIAIFAPAAVLSAISPVVVKLRLANLAETGTVVGRLSGIGTLGGIAATFGTGFVLISLFSVTAILTGLGVVLLVSGVLLTVLLSRSTAPALTASLLVLGVCAGGATAVVPAACDVETRYHCARVVTDPHRVTGRILELDTLRHSYVDLQDPTHLEFSYTQAIAAVLDTFRPPGTPINALHLGAGGLTIPRYLAHTRPDTTSLVAEIDPGVLQLAHDKLGFTDNTHTGNGITTTIGDARTITTNQPHNTYDTVIGDAFGSISVPWHLSTREFVQQIRRVLTPNGVYVLNVIDNPPLEFLAAELRTVAAVFDHVAVAANPAALRGSDGGNYVLIASAQPLPEAALRERLAARSQPLKLATESIGLRELMDDAPILTDDYAPVDQLLTTS